jgi:tetratricopeptide (TPR) repeat protein
MAFATFERHPSDYKAAGLLARQLYRRRDSRAVGAVNRALALNPHHSDLHLLAARMLYSSKHKAQALVEYGLALERSNQGPKVVAELLARFDQPKPAAHGLPLAAGSLERITPYLRKLAEPATALLYGQRFADRHPRSAAAHRYIALNASDLGAHDLALKAATKAAQLEPGPTSVVALSTAQGAAGEWDRAAVTTRTTLSKHAGSLARKDELLLLRALARAEKHAGRPDAAKIALRDALSLTAGDRRMAAALHRELARIESAQGNTHRAAWERTRAAELERK